MAKLSCGTPIVFIFCILSLFATAESVDTETILRFVETATREYIKAKNAIHDTTTSPDALTRLSATLEAAILHLKRIRWYIGTDKPCAEPLLTTIIKNLAHLESKVGEMVDQIRCLVPFLVEELAYRAPRAFTGTVGRPNYIITKEQLQTMRSYGLSWIDIAKALGVSISTIWRMRVKLQIEMRRHRGRKLLSKKDLKALIQEVQVTSPNVGIIMIEGEVAGRGYYAPRSDISAILLEMDPMGALLRWNEQIPRVAYNVPGPNSLWHIDGNHKLIRWKLVIHGGIDGFSRLVVFIKCSANNKAETVGRLFLEATEKFCWPSRVRTDKGGENSEVARLMINKRGEGRGSILQGSSVHNQRIERLWRDMRKMVTEYYRRLFFFLEDNNLINLDSDTDLFSLHYVYIPRINANLLRFQRNWNNHKLSSEHQKTPNQLYLLGMMRLFGSNYTAVKDFFEDNEVDPDQYGNILPEDGEHTHDTDFNGAVIVPIINAEISAACLAEVRTNVDPLENDTNHGIPLYIRTREIISRYRNRRPELQAAV